MGDFQPCPSCVWNHKKYQIQPCPEFQSWWDSNDWLIKIIWICIKLRFALLFKPRAFQGYTPKIWRNKRKRHKITNMQKLWRRDYNFNVNKEQIPLARFYKNSLWKGDFISFKSTTHDIIEFNPVSFVIVASHIRSRAMIIASFTSMLRISVKHCDHHSQPDVWGNNDRQNRIKPLSITQYTCITALWKQNNVDIVALWELITL